MPKDIPLVVTTVHKGEPHHVAGETVFEYNARQQLMVELILMATEIATRIPRSTRHCIPQRRLTAEENREHWGKRE